MARITHKNALPITLDRFDFSSYQPGDVIIFSLADFARMGQAHWTLLVSAVTAAAVQAGLGWRVERDELNYECRVTFTEPGHG